MLKLLPLALLLLLTGCASLMPQPIHYDVGLAGVERPANARERYGEAVMSEASEEDETKYIFSDSLVTVTWFVLPKQLAFNLKNNTNHSIKVVWDEAAFVDTGGQASRVMHEGVRYVDRNAPMAASVVPRGGELADIIVPTNRVTYVEGRYGGWETLPLILPGDARADGAANKARENVGKHIRVVLPLEIEGVVNEYSFTFEVYDVEVPEAGSTPAGASAAEPVGVPG